MGTELTINKHIAAVNIGDSFSTNREVLTNMFNTDKTKEYTADIIAAYPDHSLTAKRRDTSIGGNDAINCYYQFNENDDIIHPVNQVSSNAGGGMGRVYNETFDQQQQIMHMTFGVPDFSNAADFIANAYNADLAKVMNVNDTDALSNLGTFLGYVFGKVITLPFLPIILLNKIIKKITEGTPSKYYDIQPTMGLYYQMVNSILAHLAVNMDLFNTDGTSPEGVPELLKKRGIDILTILLKKHDYNDLDNTVNNTREISRTVDIFEKLKSNKTYEKDLWQKFSSGTVAAFMQELMFVGFRIDKSVDSSESATNTTKEPEILNMINQQVSVGREAFFNLGAIRETTGGNILNKLYSGLTSFASGVLSTVGLHGGVELLKGSGFIDIPEIYASSSFSKSYNFHFQLRTPYGDKLSIFYSLYIPLAMILAAAFPRSVGENAYTSPFLVKAYCKGMFSIPMGIIDSITITRGSSEYGWNVDMLPTQIDVTFTIKDLSPIMHIALNDSNLQNLWNIFGQNSSFQEYMLTLSGVDVAQRILFKEKFEKRKNIIYKIAENNYFNPTMIAMNCSERTSIGRLITKLIPGSRLPGAKK